MTTFLIILALFAAGMIYETVRLVLRDARGPKAPPASHHSDMFDRRNSFAA
jgi:hypothetical protein